MRNDKVKSLIANTIDLYSDTNINQEIINNGLLKLVEARDLLKNQETENPTLEEDLLKIEFESKYSIDILKDAYEIPYIAREYYDHTFGLLENVKIGFFVDTYYQDGFEEREHNVFKISIFVDHNLHKVLYVNDGSHIMDLGILSEGEHVISFEALDIYGRRSYRDYFEIRVKEKEAINKYVITNEDLNKYGVIKDGTSDTTESFNNMMNELSKTYNYLVIPQGTYLSTIDTSFIPPSNVTIDLNGSTLKLQEKQVGSGCKQLKFMQGEDIHVINGKIVGDKDTHDYENSPNGSEWLLGFEISGRCKYSSLENVEISNITGYGGGCGFGADRNGSGYCWASINIPTAGVTSNVKPSPNGLIFSYNNPNYIDISRFKVDGCNNFAIGRYLGYQGMPCISWYFGVEFYDENKNFIEDLVIMYYRRVFIPPTAKYIKVKTIGTSKAGFPTSDFGIWSFKVPVNFEIKNCKFDDIRCVGFAPSAQESLRMIDCDVARSGYNAARCAFDAEDGWEMMHDFYMSGTNFHDNPNNDWLTCAGLNFLLENNEFDDGSMYVWSRTDGIVIRNNKLNGSITATKPSYDTRNPYKVYNNEVTGSISIPTELGSIKNCKAKSISGKVIE